jgi:hypothetical protein
MSTPPNPFNPWINHYLSGAFQKHYLNISISFPSNGTELVAHNHVQQVINGAGDWLRYASNCWIVWTNETPQQWYNKLAAIEMLKPSSIFILKVDISRTNRAGQFPDWIWQWLDKTRF